MSRTFENPANGHREAVGSAQSILAFLFCGPYLLLKGLWGHFAVVVLFIAPAAYAGGPVVALVASLVIGFFYALAIQSIISGKYLRAGWLEIAKTSSGEEKKATGKPDQRACPFCGEDVLAVAIKCKHCGSSIEPVKDEGSEPVRDLTREALELEAEQLGVKRSGKIYLYQEHQYTRIEDAIDYAKRYTGEA